MPEVLLEQLHRWRRSIAQLIHMSFLRLIQDGVVFEGFDVEAVRLLT